MKSNSLIPTILLSALFIQGCDLRSKTTASIVASVPPVVEAEPHYAFYEDTEFTEGTESSQTSIKSGSAWTKVDYSGSDSTVHPYEQMNVHKVHSYSDGTNNLTGVGQLIHMADFNCDTNHTVFQNKTVHNLDNGDAGESAFSVANSSQYHCQSMVSMAAGGTSGDNLVQGVAPDAGLILSSIPNYDGNNKTDDYARDLDSARGLGAVVSNNSWSMSDWNLTEIQSLATANNWTNAQVFTLLMEGNLNSTSTTSTESYITALNNFQKEGVVVFAAGNYSGESDASVMAALPELISDLSSEAWLSVAMVDFTGTDISTATGSEFSLKGNPCGSSKEYCLVTDGWQVNSAGWVDNGDSIYKEQTSGSSLSAAMVSGGVALMSQAFPNHTPEQITDRILASANNSWFTPEGETTFTTNGAGVKHGYHSTWGHGIPDFHAALAPILTDSNPTMSIYTGDSIQSSESKSLSSSVISSSMAFGNTVSQALSGEVGYAYDSMNGGFAYDMSSRVTLGNDYESAISLSTELSKLDAPISTKTKESKLTLGTATLPVQNFYGELSDLEVPYLQGEGLGLSTDYQFGDSKLRLGASSPADGVGNRKSVIASLEFNRDNTSVTLMSGVTSNNDNLLGLQGSSAFNTLGSKSDTIFTGVKVESSINDSFTITGLATFANSDMSSPADSLINDATNVRSSSLALVATQKEITGDDKLSFSISQPNRINGGQMSIKTSSLAASTGAITHNDKKIDLEAGGRQIAYGLSYRKDFDEDFSFSLKHILTAEVGHMEENAIAQSSYVGVNYKDLKVGYIIDSLDSSRTAQLSYTYSF